MVISDLYLKYRLRLLKICMRYSYDYAEDILHDAFIKIINNINTFKNQCSVYTWMVSITKNTALNFLRDKKEHYSIHKMKDIPVKIDYCFISDAVRKLTPGCNKIFNMVQDGYSHIEISEILQIKDVSSRTQYHKARKILMNYV